MMDDSDIIKSMLKRAGIEMDLATAKDSRLFVERGYVGFSAVFRLWQDNALVVSTPVVCECTHKITDHNWVGDGTREKCSNCACEKG